VHRTTFVNARIFDGVQSDYLDDSVVIVEADRIVSVERNRSPSAGGDVVDVGGGEAGIARAVEDRLIRGPWVFFAGRALSMTGGHGDFRDPFNEVGACGCSGSGRVAWVVDGEDAVRAAAREELRHGAHCIKIMLSGG
jgi:imidazolonepropionase-like amidohydrolase